MKYFVALIILLSSLCCHAQPYSNLALEGGGIRGIAYTGALKVLEEKGLLTSIERVSGTSVGAIVAGLLAVGYNAGEMKQIMNNLRIQQFNDGRWFFIGGFNRMNRNFGWYRGERLEEWIGKLIAAKTGSPNTTLLQLHTLSQQNKKYKDPYILATNLTRQRPEIFYYRSHPNIPLKSAIRASMSIPLYFSAVFIDSSGNLYKKQNKRDPYDVFADGGIVANYPVAVFDTMDVDHNTLGLKLERPEQVKKYEDAETLAPYDIDDFQSYIAALYNIIIERLNTSTSFKEEKTRTIYISTGNINPRVRKITKEQKELMYLNGKTAAEKFLAEEGKH